MGRWGILRIEIKETPCRVGRHRCAACPVGETWLASERRAPTMSLQRRVRAGRGASWQGAWVCLISWPRAALRKLICRSCLNGAALGRVESSTTGHEIKQTQESVRRHRHSLVDAPRPARTHLCPRDFLNAKAAGSASEDGSRIKSGMTIGISFPDDNPIRFPACASLSRGGRRHRSGSTGRS
jgi:hypothetical protein